MHTKVQNIQLFKNKTSAIGQIKFAFLLVCSIQTCSLLNAGKKFDSGLKKNATSILNESLLFSSLLFSSLLFSSLLFSSLLRLSVLCLFFFFDLFLVIYLLALLSTSSVCQSRGRVLSTVNQRLLMHGYTSAFECTFRKH